MVPARAARLGPPAARSRGGPPHRTAATAQRWARRGPAAPGQSARYVLPLFGAPPPRPSRHNPRGTRAKPYQRAPRAGRPPARPLGRMQPLAPAALIRPDTQHPAAAAPPAPSPPPRQTVGHAILPQAARRPRTPSRRALSSRAASFSGAQRGARRFRAQGGAAPSPARPAPEGAVLARPPAPRPAAVPIRAMCALPHVAPRPPRRGTAKVTARLFRQRALKPFRARAARRACGRGASSHPSGGRRQMPEGGWGGLTFRAWEGG
jgi:hypothetical protein